MSRDLIAELQSIKDKYNSKLAIKEQLEKEVTSFKVKIHNIDKEIEVNDKAVLMLTEVSLNAKRSVTSFLEGVVTDALQYISAGQYKFEIDIDDTGKTAKCEFYVVETVDGETSRQKPEDSCGGGFVDIISNTLRYAYLSLYNNPKLMGCIIADEPGKMISSEMSVKFGEFIKNLCNDFDRQTIMITHNDNLQNVADNIEIMTKVV